MSRAHIITDEDGYPDVTDPNEPDIPSHDIPLEPLPLEF